MSENFWDGQAEDIPTSQLPVSEELVSEYCTEYDDRCPRDRPETVGDLMKCAEEKKTCENALESMFWRCFHSKDGTEAQSRLHTNRDPANMCYGVQKAFYGAGLA